jgi:hypothetical protein
MARLESLALEFATMLTVERPLLTKEHLEVLAQSAQDESLVFASDNESEAINFAVEYHHRCPGQTVSVLEERFDPADRLFKSRRVWRRAAHLAHPVARPGGPPV